MNGSSKTRLPQFFLFFAPGFSYGLSKFSVHLCNKGRLTDEDIVRATHEVARPQGGGGGGGVFNIIITMPGRHSTQAAICYSRTFSRALTQLSIWCSPHHARYRWRGNFYLYILIRLIPKTIGIRKKKLCVRLRSGDKHHPRKSADRKAQFSPVSETYAFLICALRSADSLGWCLSPECNLTHNLFFSFQ